jgi:prepilin-type N-terminal cleavage/methylation domain-containing protein
MKLKRDKQKGFTLIEMIIVIVILGVVATFAGMMISVAARGSNQQYQLSSAGAEAQQGLERMAREIRIALPSTLTMNATSVSFTDVNGESISFSLSSGNLLRGSNVLIEGVSSLTFSYYDSAGAVTSTAADVRYIAVNMTVNDGGVGANLRTLVFLRNAE